MEAEGELRLLQVQSQCGTDTASVKRNYASLSVSLILLRVSVVALSALISADQRIILTFSESVGKSKHLHSFLMSYTDMISERKNSQLNKTYPFGMRDFYFVAFSIRLQSPFSLELFGLFPCTHARTHA